MELTCDEYSRSRYNRGRNIYHQAVTKTEHKATSKTVWHSVILQVSADFVDFEYLERLKKNGNFF